MSGLESESECFRRIAAAEDARDKRDRRDRFAMAALQGAISYGYGNGAAELAELAVKHADALIAELDKP